MIISVIQKIMGFSNLISLILLFLLIINLILREKTTYEYILLILSLLGFAVIFYSLWYEWTQ